MSQAEIAYDLIQKHIEDGTADEDGYSMFHYLENVDTQRTSDDGYGIRFTDKIECLLYSESGKSWDVCSDEVDEEEDAE
jgi:hypothetical protein